MSYGIQLEVIIFALHLSTIVICAKPGIFREVDGLRDNR